MDIFEQIVRGLVGVGIVIGVALVGVVLLLIWLCSHVRISWI